MTVRIVGQKAPSTKRCIKTRVYQSVLIFAIRPSESTERQKVH